MPLVVGVRFRRAGPIYYFDPGDHHLERGQWAVVETSRGHSLARVAMAPGEVAESALAEPLKPVVRPATPEDLERQEGNRRRAAEALARARELVAQGSLAMRLLEAEYSLDASHLTLYFSAESRVDFRRLVRQLASDFQARVELRQLGARDAAKFCDGLGRCGRPLCCATYLSSLESVSMKMAKDQDLPLNPAKLSGLCGRLLCCLGYEVELYRQLKKQLPRAGQKVATPAGEAVVMHGNALKETVLVTLPSQAVMEIPLRDITPCGPASADQPAQGEGTPEGA